MSALPIQVIDGVTVVEAAGRLDALVAPQLDQALKAALAAGQGRLLIDMAGASYISSSCLRVVLLGARQARQVGGDLRLCCLMPRVRQILALAGFDLVLTLCETRAQALAAFAAPPGGTEATCTHA